MIEQTRNVKIWKLAEDSPAQIAVTEDSVTIVGSKKQFIKTGSGGNVIYGPTSIVAGSESIRTGGAYVSLPEAVQSLPSTEVTPLPGKVSIPPVHVAFDLAEDVGFFAALLV